MKSTTQKSVIYKIYISEFFAEFIPIYVIFPIMFVERGGVSAAGVGVLLAVWQIVIVVADVPTGIFADHFPRKYALLMGKMFRIFTYPIWLLYPHFYGYLAGFILLGIGDAFLSGSLEAYIYDELQDQKLFSHVNQKTASIHLAAFGIAGFVAVLFGARYNTLLVLSTVSSLLALLFGFLLPTDTIQTRVATRVTDLVKTARRVLKPTESIYVPFLSACVVMAVMIVQTEYISTFYKSTGISTRLVALLISGGNMLTFVILWNMHRIGNGLKKHRLALLTIFVALPLVAVLLKLPAAVQIMTIFLFVRMVRMVNIQLANELQQVATSSIRATTGSLVSFIAQIAAAASIALVGLFSHQHDIRLPLVVSAIAGIVLLGYITKPRQKVRSGHGVK